MEGYISEVIAVFALLFSIYTQIKQSKSEKKLNNLREELFKKQSEISDLILEKEKNVEIHVTSRERAKSDREMVFRNIGNVNAENFNVEFKGNLQMLGDPPVLPATLFRGQEFSFWHEVNLATKGTVDVEMTWTNPKTGLVHKEQRIVNLL